MRIVVTGAAGFIGSHVAERLLDDGHTVLGVDCLLGDSYPSSIKAGVWNSLRERPRFIAVAGDLRSLDLDLVLEGADVVINEAAMPGLMRSWEQFPTYAACNVVALERLLRAATRAGLHRFVQVSTSSVYGADAVCDETAATAPVSPYGVTKLAAEHLLHAYRINFGVPGIVLRYFSVYGPRQRPDMAYHKFCEALLDGKPLVVYGDGTQSRSNTYVGDCVEGTIQAIKDARVGETYNIAGAHSIALIDAIAHLAEHLGVRPNLLHRPGRPGDQRHTRGDSSKARQHFGYDPVVAPREGLGMQAAWHRAKRGSVA